MTGAEATLLEQGVLGAIILLLVAAVVALWFQQQKEAKATKKDICNRNDALTGIIENAIHQELELANKMAEQSMEAHTAITLLTGYLKEQEERMRQYERGQNNSRSG